MAYNYEYPYTNVKENADWILHELKCIIAECDLTKKTVEDLKKEIEELFSHFGEEIMKQLQFLIEDGTMQRLIQQAMLANLPTTHAHCSWFGQIVPTLISNGKAQGFCTYESGADTLAAQCFISDGNSEIAIVNMTTGNYVDSGAFGHNVLGHANSMTYDPKHDNFFIAGAGGDSTQKHIVRVNSALTNTLTYGESIEAYAVAYAHDHLYCLVGDGNLAVYDIDEEGALVISSLVIKRFDRRTDTVAQGLYTDGKYLFIPNGNYYGSYTPTDNKVIANYIDVYDMQANFVTSMTVDTGLEIEEVSISKDIAYVSCNSGNKAVILKTQLYSTLQSLQSVQNLPMRFSINNYVPRIYIDETYTGFFMDGTINRPLSNAFWIAQYYYMSGIASIDVYFNSDCDKNLTFFNFDSIKLDFQNHEMSGTIYAINYKSFTIDNMINTAKTSPIVSCNRGIYTYMTNDTFRGNGGSFAMSFIATQVTINNLDMSAMTGDVAFRCIEGATVRISSSNLGGKHVNNHESWRADQTTLTSGLAGFYYATSDNRYCQPNKNSSIANDAVLELERLTTPCDLLIRHLSNNIGLPVDAQYEVNAVSYDASRLYVRIINRETNTVTNCLVHDGAAYIV